MGVQWLWRWAMAARAPPVSSGKGVTPMVGEWQVSSWEDRGVLLMPKGCKPSRAS